MTAERCEFCNAMIDLVGIRHRCIPRIDTIAATIPARVRETALAVDTVTDEPAAQAAAPKVKPHNRKAKPPANAKKAKATR